MTSITPMPEYRSCTKVYALKIKEVYQRLNEAEDDPDEIQMLISFEDPTFAPIHVTAEYIAKWDPQPGGYYRVTEGYAAFMSAGYFEDEHELVDDPPLTAVELVGEYLDALKTKFNLTSAELQIAFNEGRIVKHGVSNKSQSYGASLTENVSLIAPNVDENECQKR